MARAFRLTLVLLSFLTTAVAIPKSAEAGKEVDVFEEAQVVIALCSKLLLSQQGDFSGLKARGYSAKPKSWGTVYKIGSGQYAMFGVGGVVVRQSAQGCSVRLMGIETVKGSYLFRQFQANFIKNGYRAGSSGNVWGTKRYLTKGADKITVLGTIPANEQVLMEFFRETDGQ